jgi:hypothetical protein
MTARALVGILLLAATAVGRAQEEQAAPPAEEVLWMPEGYRLLSLEERNALPPEQMREIGARNTTLLREAIAAMSPAERAEVGMALSRYGQGREVPQYVRQYVAMTTMMLLAAGAEERSQADRAAIEDRYQKLLREQESTTRGFPGDQESVAKEADAIEARLGEADRRALYLRTLRPLRARPWNDAIRICFRKIVRGDSTPRAQKTSLYDAALVFVQSRQKESPEEGAWYSLEAFLRLSMRGEVADARRLFAIAVQRNARDVESRVFPILLAEVEGDTAQVERLMPRAREAWPKAEDLDRVLLDNIDVLPAELQAKAREAFGGKYKRAHPSDWPSRAEILAASIERGAFREVESETGALLALPASTLPADARVEFRALRLRAIAGLGRCDEVVAEIPQLEAAVHEAYRESDGENPPAPRTAQDVQELRAELQEGRRGLVKLRAAIADGSVEGAPELVEEVPKAERRAAAEVMASEYGKELSRMEAMLRGGSDTAIAAEWSRRELEAWREAERMPENALYDRADRGSRLVIQVRSAAGKCLLAHQRTAEAARVLAPCVGSGANYHGDCGEPILEAGRELVKQGRWKEAASVYTVTAPIDNFSSRAEDLYREIEKAAPGTVTHFQPTPRPTPRITTPVQVQP